VTERLVSPLAVLATLRALAEAGKEYVPPASQIVSELFIIAEL
jgi:hypothetical protein